MERRIAVTYAANDTARVLERIAAQMDEDQRQFLFPMWSNVNIPALAMRLLALRDDREGRVIVQTIGIHWSGDCVLRMWNVYGAETVPPFEPETLVDALADPPSVELSRDAEARVQRTARRSIPDASPHDRETFLAFARAVEARRAQWFLPWREVRARWGTPSMRVVARYRDWPELDLAEEELPSASRFFRKVFARIAG